MHLKKAAFFPEFAVKIGGKPRKRILFSLGVPSDRLKCMPAAIGAARTPSTGYGLAKIE
jgi:hypothetical protein